jgi:hypothetical protein
MGGEAETRISGTTSRISQLKWQKLTAKMAKKPKGSSSSNLGNSNFDQGWTVYGDKLNDG